MKLYLILIILLFVNLVHADQHTYYVKTRNSTSPAGGAKDLSVLDYWISPEDYNGNYTETPLLTTFSGTNLTFVLTKNSTDGFVICSTQGCGNSVANLGNAYPHGLTINGTSFNWTVPFVSVATAFYYGAYLNVYWGNSIYVLPAIPPAPTSTIIDEPGDDWTGDTWRDVAGVFIALFILFALLLCCCYREGHRFVRVPNSSS